MGGKERKKRENSRYSTGEGRRGHKEKNREGKKDPSFWEKEGEKTREKKLTALREGDTGQSIFRSPFKVRWGGQS